VCTIAAAIGQFSRFPVVIAANRDEVMDRPSSPPFVWPGPVPFLAPRDDKAGGTWMGLNAVGLFVAITNRFMSAREEARTSRGHIVTRALALPDVGSLHRELSGMDVLAFNAFNLFYADASGAAGVTWSDGERLAQQRLEPGVHAITERSFGAARADRASGIVARWPPPLPGGDPDMQALQLMLARHDERDPLASLCIHLPQFNFGTRSSAVLLLARTVASSRFFWAEGSPCRNTYLDQGTLVRALASTPSAEAAGT
jgi:Transport and Golgi organisation 2